MNLIGSLNVLERNKELLKLSKDQSWGDLAMLHQHEPMYVDLNEVLAGRSCVSTLIRYI